MPMPNRRRVPLVVGVVAVAWVAPRAARGDVTLTFSDKDATPANATVVPGGTFGVSVVLTETATTDRVSGVDYRLVASASNDFKLVSRTSTTSTFTPEVADASPSVAPVTLSPTNGSADLGGDRNGAADLVGPNGYNVADYSVMVLSSTPVGRYTVSFTGAGNFVLPTYSGSSAANFPTQQFTSTNAFTIDVVAAPEPTSAVLLAGPTVGLVTLARRRRRAADSAAAAESGTTD